MTTPTPAAPPADPRTADLLDYYWQDEPIYAPGSERLRPRGAVQLDRALALVLGAGLVLLSRWTLSGTGELGGLSWVLVVLAAGWTADLLSGVGHLFLDFYPSSARSSLHKLYFLSQVHHHELARPARLPLASLWLPTAWISTLALAPVCAVARWAQEQGLPSWVAAFATVLLWLATVSQVTHGFAHGKAMTTPVRPLLRLLQAARLILPPATHARHHREIGLDFCVLNGWANPALNLVYRHLIAPVVPARTSVATQIEQMRRGLGFPYPELAHPRSAVAHGREV